MTVPGNLARALAALFVVGALASPARAQHRLLVEEAIAGAAVGASLGFALSVPQQPCHLPPVEDKAAAERLAPRLESSALGAIQTVPPPHLGSGLSVDPDSDPFPTGAALIGGISGAAVGFAVGFGLDNLINDGSANFGAGSVWGAVAGGLLGVFVGIEVGKRLD